jgi:hypothetical protein
VFREVATAHDGGMLSRELDHALASHDAAATDSSSASLPAPERLLDRGSGHFRLSGRMSFAVVDTVAL